MSRSSSIRSIGSPPLEPEQNWTRSHRRRGTSLGVADEREITSGLRRGTKLDRKKSKQLSWEDKASEIAAAFDSFTFKTSDGEDVFERNPGNGAQVPSIDNFGDFEAAFPSGPKQSIDWNGEDSLTASFTPDPKRSISWTGNASFGASSSSQLDVSIPWKGDDFGNDRDLEEADRRKPFVRQQGSNHPSVRSRSMVEGHGDADGISWSRRVPRTYRNSVTG